MMKVSKILRFTGIAVGVALGSSFSFAQGVAILNGEFSRFDRAGDIFIRAEGVDTTNGRSRQFVSDTILRRGTGTNPTLLANVKLVQDDQITKQVVANGQSLFVDLIARREYSIIPYDVYNGTRSETYARDFFRILRQNTTGQSSYATRLLSDISSGGWSNWLDAGQITDIFEPGTSMVDPLNNDIIYVATALTAFTVCTLNRNSPKSIVYEFERENLNAPYQLKNIWIKELNVKPGVRQYREMVLTIYPNFIANGTEFQFLPRTGTRAIGTR